MIKGDEDRLRRIMKRAIPVGGYSKRTVMRLIQMLLRMVFLAYDKGATTSEIEESLMSD